MNKFEFSIRQIRAANAAERAHGAWLDSLNKAEEIAGEEIAKYALKEFGLKVGSIVGVDGKIMKIECFTHKMGRNGVGLQIKAVLSDANPDEHDTLEELTLDKLEKIS